MMRLLVVALPLLLAGCITVGIGADAALQVQHVLHDNGTPPAQRAQPLVDALLIQPLPGDATADTVSIAYSRRAHEFAFYQLASWSERPVRRVPRLLQRRLEAHGLAAAIGMLGDPVRSDWLLTIVIDTMVHDVAAPPGQARFALTAELFDRRTRTRVARRQFGATAASARVDSAAAAEAMSAALTQVFDAMLPWLDASLARSGSTAAR